jgi:hypothetical protein
MMKKIFISLFLIFSFTALFSQAKKPIIMVIPSDSYCSKGGFESTYKDESGNVKSTPDYEKAFKNDESLRLVISELSNIMAQRGFPLKDMEQTLKQIKNEEVEISLLQSSGGSVIIESPLDQIKRVAKADIIMDIDFSIQSRGPSKYITFNLRGLDAYTSKVITAVSGDGRPSTVATPGLLLEEAVLNYMDSFNGALQAHFNDMFENGREVTITIRMFDASPVTFEDEFQYMGESAPLLDIIDFWMDENCVNHRFSRTIGGDYVIKYEQVRTPLFRTVFGKERAADTRSFVTQLGKFLSAEPFNLPYKIYERGLGEAWIILGDK